MAEKWERWANRGDATVVHEARPIGDRYEFRGPGGEVLGTMDAETWEAIYEKEAERDAPE